MFYDNNDCNIASYADDNTPYGSSSNLDAVIKKLQESVNKLLQWFRNNQIILMLTKVIFWLWVTINPLSARGFSK